MNHVHSGGRRNRIASSGVDNRRERAGPWFCITQRCLGRGHAGSNPWCSTKRYNPEGVMMPFRNYLFTKMQKVPWVLAGATGKGNGM